MLDRRICICFYLLAKFFPLLIPYFFEFFVRLVCHNLRLALLNNHVGLGKHVFMRLVEVLHVKGFYLFIGREGILVVTGYILQSAIECL